MIGNIIMFGILICLLALGVWAIEKLFEPAEPFRTIIRVLAALAAAFLLFRAAGLV